jgi:hypothetical protein
MAISSPVMTLASINFTTRARNISNDFFVPSLAMNFEKVVRLGILYSFAFF